MVRIVSCPFLRHGLNSKLPFAKKIVLDKNVISLSIICSCEKITSLSQLFTLSRICWNEPFLDIIMQSSTYLNHVKIWPWRFKVFTIVLSRIFKKKSAKSELNGEPILTPFFWLKKPTWERHKSFEILYSYFSWN